MKIVGKIVPAFLAVSLQGIVYAGPLDNCLEFIKYGTPNEQGDLLCRKGYALAHNPNHKTPDWVAQHLTAAQAGAVLSRSDDFRADPDLPVGLRAELSEYNYSGYDCGQMAPAGDMRWDAEAMSQSFLLSNICPQVGVGMNLDGSGRKGAPGGDRAR